MSSTHTAPRMKLKTGLDPLERVHLTDTRGLSFHGMGAFVGTGRTQRAHVYTAASIPVDPEAYKKIDPEKLAGELGVDMCAVNRGRFWMMDELDIAVGRSPGLPRRRDAVGRRHDRRRDARPVPERVHALADLPQHQLDLPRGQAGLPAPRSGGCDLGAAGVHEGRRPESRRPTTSRCSATSTRSCRKAGRSRRRSSTRTSRSTRPAPAAGPRSSATSSTAPTRAAATAQTPVPTTSRKRDSKRAGPGSAGACSLTAPRLGEPRRERRRP